MGNHLDNQILARLSEATFASLAPHLAVIDLERGKVLAETHATIHKVYFPHSGIISCVVELVGGGAIETGMIGKDGQFGAGAAFDGKVSLNFVVVQVAGKGSVIDVDRFREAANEHPELRRMAAAYEQFFLGHVQQTSACNAVHMVQARMCKWLLRMQALAGDDLQLTQEFLAQMMGVRRTSVTAVAVDLQQAGMITYSRGQIHIVDLQKIRRTACECDAAVNSHYSKLFS
jgi:CRP-like cAMP-binding protein